MELAYRYKGIDVRREAVQGIVIAQDQDLADFRLRAMEIRDATLTWDPLATLSIAYSPGFPLRETYLFYKSLGSRLASGMSTSEAILSSAELLESARLIQAARLMSLAVRTLPIEAAMTRAGFPAKDCALIGAARAMGEESSTFKNMASELQKQIELRKDIVKSLAPTAAALIALAVLMWGFLVIMAPQQFETLTKNGMLQKMTPWVQEVYRFSASVSSVWPLFTGAYFGFFALLIYAVKHGFAQPLIAVIPSLPDLIMRWEQARLWRAFQLVQRTQLGYAAAFRMLMESTPTPELRETLRLAARKLDAGAPLAAVIAESTLPSYVKRYMRGVTADKLDESLTMMIEALETDAGVLQLKVLYSSSAIALCVVGALLITAMWVLYGDLFMTIRKML
jgi:type II secretory pathway component PulF